MTNPRQCASGTLQDYINLNPSQLSLSEDISQAPFQSGCSIGFVNFDNFSFNPIAGSPQDASEIMVDPVTFGFSFSLVSTQQPAPPFTGPAHFQIGYNFEIDPAPVLDGAELTLDPPGGAIDINQYYCLDGFISPFATNAGGPSFNCSNTNGGFYMLHVDASNQHAQAIFNPTTMGGADVLTDILLGSDGHFDMLAGSASITGSPNTPEPVSSALVALGIGMIALKKRKTASPH